MEQNIIYICKSITLTGKYENSKPHCFLMTRNFSFEIYLMTFWYFSSAASSNKLPFLVYKTGNNLEFRRHATFTQMNDMSRKILGHLTPLMSHHVAACHPVNVDINICHHLSLSSLHSYVVSNWLSVPPTARCPRIKMLTSDIYGIFMLCNRVTKHLAYLYNKEKLCLSFVWDWQRLSASDSIG